jgi:hypothetical protein
LPDKHEMFLLTECIRQVSAALGDEESIIQIRKGRTRPGRQVFHFYKVDFGVLDKNLQGPPKDRRSLMVVINQDSPASADIRPAEWEPWDHLYGD